MDFVRELELATGVAADRPRPGGIVSPTPPVNEGRKKRSLGKIAAALALLAALVVGVPLGLWWVIDGNGGTATTPEGLWLPRDFRAVDNQRVKDIDQHEYYKRIESTLPSLQSAVFVLVPRESAGDPPSFYLLRNRVSNTLYAALEPQSGRRADDLPAVWLTAKQAHDAARKLGGKLPAVKQYEKALGFLGYEEKKGVIGAIAGFEDLPGKGLEFTRNLTAEEGSAAEKAKVEDKEVGLADPPKGTLVILSGRLASAKEPLRFEDLKEQRKTPLPQFYDSPSPYTGFRVVLEPPP
jgi:hypothetical protein